jgi:arylsulfatase A-like enzyme
MTLARRSATVVLLGLASIAALLALGPLRSQSTTSRPDIIVVLTDQQRADAFGAAGAPELRTPTMDRLAREGVRFTNAFAATPQCSPSRAALMTGRYPHRTGVMGNVADAGGGGVVRPAAGMSGPLDPSLPTLASVFARAGYDTAYFGKWHLGATPGDYGFATHDAKVDDKTLAGRVAAFLDNRKTASSARPLLLVVSWLNPHEIYGILTKTPSDRALAAARLPSNRADDLRSKPFPQRHFLEQDQGKPFVAASDELWRRYRAFYNELVETVDAEIGTVLSHLPRRDVPPITIFGSDHGDYSGAHGLPYKGPAMYEEVVRIPLVISWPGRIRAASSDAIVTLMDALPTICDLANVRLPDGVDGLSLRPILEGGSTRVRDSLVVEYYGKQAWRVPIRMLRTARWKYVRYAGYGEELYDLSTDPGELRNLAADPGSAAALKRLSGDLDQWIARTADPFPTLAATDRGGVPVVR